MAHSAHTDAEALKERFEDEETLDRKTNILVRLIRESKYFVAFTGAGLSTSAGIPDFRGPEGVWTLQAQGRMRSGPTTSVLKAMPTVSHMSLVALQNAGIMKYLISQNVDGLHRRSGMLPEKLSELHGNSNLEYCKKCKKEYLRDFDATASYQWSVRDHRTGRKCDICGENLHDTIINFGENLPDVPLRKAWEASEQADLHLVLGSSLTVQPACKMPKLTTKAGGKLVIVNLQHTPLDEHSYLRIYAKTDDVLRLVMQKLSMTIPPFILLRQLRVREEEGWFGRSIVVDGVEMDDIPASFVHNIKVEGEEKKLTTEPYSIKIGNKSQVGLRIGFRGHYNEPALDIKHTVSPKKGGPEVTLYRLEYNPLTGVWVVGEPRHQFADKEKNEEKDKTSKENAKVPVASP